MSYSYEDYVAYYKYYYGEQYGTYYAQQAAAAAGVQVGVAAAAPPPPNSQNTGYPTAYPPMGSRPSPGAGAPPHLSTQYPPPSSYQPSSRPGGGGGGGGGGERQAPKRPWGQIGTGGLGYQGSRDKKAKKPPVPSVTCKICDVTVSSQQVYESHLAGKAHKKKASQVKSGKSQETVWKPEKSESGNTFAAIPPPDQAAAVVQKPGTGVIISGAPVEAGGSGPKVSIVTPEDTFSPDRRQQQQQPSTKSRNKPQKAKKRKGFGFGSGGGDDGEQEVFQCELCNITVNSQQQLDMHLTGAKHKKCVESNKRSQDPAIQAKLKAAAELSAAAEVRKANPETANTDKKDSDFEARSQLSSQPNLPPGYIFLPASQSEQGVDTYLCSACQHYSSDLFSLNAHVSSAEHQTKSADQDHPLGSLGSSGTPQAKMAGQKTNFNLKYGQTADGVGHWGAKKVPQVKKRPHLLSSFVSAGSNAR